MGLREQVLDDMKTAMKAQQADRLSAIRMLQAAIKYREIELRPNAITDQDILGVVKKLTKQRKDSIEEFTKAGRTDLAQGQDVLDPGLCQWPAPERTVPAAWLRHRLRPRPHVHPRHPGQGRSGPLRAADLRAARRLEAVLAQLPRWLAGGTKLFRFPQDAMDAGFKAANALYDEISAKNPTFKKIYDDQVKARAEMNLWFRIAEAGFDGFMQQQKL